MDHAPTRLLIVDDSALYRQAIRNVLRDVDDVEIVGVAKDGADAMAQIEALSPELLTLDVQMPDMDGIAVLREINRRRLPVSAIMVSSLTSEGAAITTDALLEGAFDFILKPSGPDSTANRTRLRDELDEKIAAFRQATDRAPTPAPAPDAGPAVGAGRRAVVVGTSTGGPAALKALLPALSASLPAPVLVVQHMPAEYTRSLAARLDGLSGLEVVEPASGRVVEPGSVLVAPGGRQMGLVRRGGRVVVGVNDDPEEHGCRPAVDYLLRSAVEVFDGEILAVIMTGMGRDGAEGCALVKQRGGTVFAQHERGCLVYGMPKAVIERDLADRVLPLDRLASAINQHVGRGVHA
jgi:two-component system chemotaxis response regulator CheB